METIAQYIFEASWSSVRILDWTPDTVDQLLVSVVTKLAFVFGGDPKRILITQTNVWGIRNEERESYSSDVDFERAKTKKLVWLRAFAAENWYIKVKDII